MAGRGAGGDEGPSRLGRERLWFLILLGLPSLGLALAVTTVSSLLPVLLESISGGALATALIGIEGIFALLLPPLIGAASDATRSSIGPRLPFVLAATPLIVVALALMPVSGSIAVMALLLVCFYLGYFTYFVPHFALYVDLVPKWLRGRSQGVMNMLREVGLGIALVAGPTLLAADDWIPFVAAATVVAAISTVFVVELRRRSSAHASIGSGTKSVRTSLPRTWGIIRRERTVRRVVIANALWETSLNALRAFVVLYFTVGLGYSAATTSLVLALVALAALIGSPVGGWLADRYGVLPVLRTTTVVYAAGVWIPAFFHSPWAVLVVPPISVAAVIVMTLPFVLLISVLPEELGEGGGEESSIFAISRGAGLLLGPLLGGLAVFAAHDVLTGSKGYGAVFLVAAAALAASAVVIRRLPEETGRPEAAPTGAAPRPGIDRTGS